MFRINDLCKVTPFKIANRIAKVCKISLTLPVVVSLPRLEVCCSWHDRAR